LHEMAAGVPGARPDIGLHDVADWPSMERPLRPPTGFEGRDLPVGRAGLTHAMDDHSREQVEAFLLQYSEDQEAGTPRPLHEYLALFPGADVGVSREYLALEGELLPQETMWESATADAPMRTVALAPPPGQETPEDLLLLGPYRLEEEIGRGGQGIVYRATHTRTGGRVALKVIQGLGPGSERILGFFKREAEIAARLDHPGLCPVYDAEVDRGVPYIAMRFIEGETLASKLSKARATSVGNSSTFAMNASDPLAAGETLLESDPGHEGSHRETRPADPPTPTPSASATRREVLEFAHFVESAARSLHAAHEAGIIHRDIKPGNIMITPEGTAVIMDFGLARGTDLDMETLTQSGDLFGTPAYMSPEQLTRSASAVDRRADVWALGVTLYECITGCRPFDAPTREALYQQIVTRDPSDPRTHRPTISRDLAIVVMTALEKDRDRRYQTAKELADELERVRRLEPIRARPVGASLRLRRWAQRNPSLATAVGGLFILLLGGLLITTHLLRETRDALNEVEAQRTRADLNAKTSQDHLQAYERLADEFRLEELIAEADRDLWPAVPSQIPALEAWLVRADALTATIPALVADLEVLRSRALDPTPDDDPTNPAGSFRFADLRERWRHDRLAAFVAALRRFDGDDPTGTTVASVEARLTLARTLDARRQEDARRWAHTIDEIADDPLYGGLVLTPQVDLVPLGRDQDSGLQEFAHLPSGSPPTRNPQSRRFILTEDTGIIFVLIPGGSFTIGAQRTSPLEPNYDPNIFSDEDPPHSLTLDPFFLSKFEMTQSQWIRAAGNNPSLAPAGSREGCTIVNPVEQVSWNEATTILHRLGLVLPTEAQWEYACRAGTSTPWWTGMERETIEGYVNLADRTARENGALWPEVNEWPELDDGFFLHSPVGHFRPNPFGLHDMLGNVWEWCLDPYSFYEQPTRPGDGLRLDPEAQHYVTRGGSFALSARAARVSTRRGDSPQLKDGDLGLRPARVLAGPP
jgi:serine/threonine protein kinase/formylglycine-generating enzyme required for sulfatase activity